MSPDSQIRCVSPLCDGLKAAPASDHQRAAMASTLAEPNWQESGDLDQKPVDAALSSPHCHDIMRETEKNMTTEKSLSLNEERKTKPACNPMSGRAPRGGERHRPVKVLEGQSEETEKKGRGDETE